MIGCANSSIAVDSELSFGLLFYFGIIITTKNNSLFSIQVLSSAFFPYSLLNNKNKIHKFNHTYSCTIPPLFIHNNIVSLTCFLVLNYYSLYSWTTSLLSPLSFSNKYQHFWYIICLSTVNIYYN